MHYNILFNGCSFTTGAELGGVEKDYEFRDKHRFSRIVSEKTSLSHINISKGGSSNSSILDRTVKWFEEGNTCNHAIIQWTSRIRIDYVDENCEYYSMFPTQPPKHIGREMAAVARKRWDYWKHYKHIHSFINDQYREDMCIYWMNYFLKDKCSFFYLKMSKDVPSVPMKYYETSTYFNYGQKKEIHYIDSIIDKSIDYCPYVPGTILIGRHPNVRGHEKIADYILKNDEYFK